MSPIPSKPNVAPPRPRSSGELEFKRKPMVDWLKPSQLATTALKTALSITFGAYADKREVQAALDPTAPVPFDYSQSDELWVDYVADAGDGFDSTYAIAWLAAQPLLRVKEPGGGKQALPRGRVLIQGGDQVYPTAARDEYADRFEGPYRAALPWVQPPEPPPHMFAIPGNHDWYDGLTSFLRLFCQGRWIGGWQTRQRRSYFALKLPHDWWLFAIDIQLESDLDDPQRAYFQSIIDSHMKTGTGSPRVILCTAEPSWVHCGAPPPAGALLTSSARPSRPWWSRATMACESKRYQNLAYFENRVLASNGIRHVVTLSGDLHHYTRYTAHRERDDDSGTIAPVAPALQPQRITAGGGGAYTYATHHMAEHIRLSERTAAGVAVTREYELRETFPSTADSRELAFSVFWLPIRNKLFSAMLASIYLLTIWVVQSASKSSHAFQKATGWDSLLEWGSARPELGVLAANCLSVLQHSPSGAILVLAVIAGSAAFGYSERQRWHHAAWGALHGVAHLTVAVLLLWWVGQGQDVSGAIPFARFVGLSLLGGWIVGGLVFAMYLLLSSFLLCLHVNELFSAQHIANYKCFLRMKVGRDLTIYPIGLRQTPEWKVAESDADHPAAWLAPDGDRPEPELIEPPIVVS